MISSRLSACQPPCSETTHGHIAKHMSTRRDALPVKQVYAKNVINSVHRLHVHSFASLSKTNGFVKLTVSMKKLERVNEMVQYSECVCVSN